MAFALLFSANISADENDDADDEKAAEESGETGQSEESEGSGEKSGESFDTLQEVVVTEAPSASKDDTADKVAVPGERLRESPRTSVLEAVSQEAADVYVTGRGVGFHGVSSGASGAVSVRGLGGSPNTQVLIVEDGVPDIQGIFGHPIPDSYVPFLIEDALVIRGGDSVLYGTNALGGVIALRSRWRRCEGYEVVNDAAFGSYNTLREQVGYLGRSGAWDSSAAFTYQSSDGHRPGAGGDNAIGQAAVRRRLSDGVSLTVRNKLLHLKGEDPGPVSHPNTDHWYNVRRDNASMEFLFDRPVFTFRAIPYYNIGRHTLYDGFRSVDTTLGGKTEAEIALPASFDLLLGLAAEAVDGDVRNRIDQEDEYVKGNQSYSAYGQLSWRPYERLLFTGGVRDLYSSEYDEIFLYKAGARWNFWRPMTFRMRAAKNFRQPTLRELYLPFPTANPDLEPETSLNADAGLELDTKHVKARVSGYRTHARNLIKYFGVWPSAEVVNIDHLTTYGVEEKISFGLQYEIKNNQAAICFGSG